MAGLSAVQVWRVSLVARWGASLLLLMACVWMVGPVMFGWYLLLAVGFVAWQRRRLLRSTTAMPPGWVNPLPAAGVTVRMWERGSGAATLQFPPGRSLLLLARDVTSLPPVQQRAVIGHEYAHLRSLPLAENLSFVLVGADGWAVAGYGCAAAMADALDVLVPPSHPDRRLSWPVRVWGSHPPVGLRVARLRRWQERSGQAEVPTLPV